MSDELFGFGPARSQGCDSVACAVGNCPCVCAEPPVELDDSIIATLIDRCEANARERDVARATADAALAELRWLLAYVREVGGYAPPAVIARLRDLDRALTASERTAADDVGHSLIAVDTVTGVR